VSWARRTDSTHAAVRGALRASGWLCVDTSRLPGFVDMVAYKPSTGRFYFVDAKSKGGKPTASQQKLVDAGWPVRFLETVEDAAQLR
jgi:hypothetical protein